MSEPYVPTISMFTKRAKLLDRAHVPSVMRARMKRTGLKVGDVLTHKDISVWQQCVALYYVVLSLNVRENNLTLACLNVDDAETETIVQTNLSKVLVMLDVDPQIFGGAFFTWWEKV